MKRIQLLALACVLGLVCGVVIAFWFVVPAGPLQLHFVNGARAEAFERDGHTLRIYDIPGDVDTVAERAQRELRADQGWQPPTLRSTDPKIVQITRVKSPRGDFQFVRVLIESVKPGRVQVTLDEGPVQRNAFSK